MANTLDFYLKLMIGDLVIQTAALRAENEVLREKLPPEPAKEPVIHDAGVRP